MRTPHGLSLIHIYDFYAISEHYRYIDRTKMLDETKAATEIAFVALAETGGIDGTTAGEHKNLFEEWQAGVSYLSLIHI